MPVLRLLAVAVAAAVFYMLLAGQVSATEIGTAVVLGVLAAAWHHAASGVSRRTFAAGAGQAARWTSAFLRMPGGVRRSLWPLARAAIMGGGAGKSLRVRFARRAADDPAEAARRATAVLAASLAPDSFVVRVRTSRDEVLMHSLAPGQSPPDPRWLS